MDTTRRTLGLRDVLATLGRRPVAVMLLGAALRPLRAIPREATAGQQQKPVPRAGGPGPVEHCSKLGGRCAVNRDCCGPGTRCKQVGNGKCRCKANRAPCAGICCPVGQACCGRCADLQTDTNNCGACFTSLRRGPDLRGRELAPPDHRRTAMPEAAAPARERLEDAMDGSRFDSLVRALVTSRRGALKTLLGGAAPGTAALVGREAVAALPKPPGFERLGTRCDQGQPCGEFVPCANGFCAPDHCWINGELVDDRAINPDNPCQRCPNAGWSVIRS